MYAQRHTCTPEGGRRRDGRAASPSRPLTYSGIARPAFRTSILSQKGFLLLWAPQEGFRVTKPCPRGCFHRVNLFGECRSHFWHWCATNSRTGGAFGLKSWKISPIQAKSTPPPRAHDRRGDRLCRSTVQEGAHQLPNRCPSQERTSLSLGGLRASTAPGRVPLRRAIHAQPMEAGMTGWHGKVAWYYTG